MRLRASSLVLLGFVAVACVLTLSGCGCRDRADGHDGGGDSGVDLSAKRNDSSASEEGATENLPDTVGKPSIPLRVSRIYTEPVDVRFKGHIVKAGGDVDVIDPEFWAVTLNYGGAESTVEPLGGTWHGYKLGPLEKRQVQFNPGGGIPARVVTVYVLTIQRPGEEPVELVESRWAKIPETYADFVVTWGKDERLAFAGKTVGQTLAVNNALYLITAISEEGVAVGDVTLPVSPE